MCACLTASLSPLVGASPFISDGASTALLPLAKALLLGLLFSVSVSVAFGWLAPANPPVLSLFSCATRNAA